jgi:hypothetical protein
MVLEGLATTKQWLLGWIAGEGVGKTSPIALAPLEPRFFAWPIPRHSAAIILWAFRFVGENEV